MLPILLSFTIDIIQSVRAVNSSSILVTWKPLNYHLLLQIEYCLVYPDLKLPCKPITVNDTDLKYYINDVMPFATYQVSISGRSNKREVTTPQASKLNIAMHLMQIVLPAESLLRSVWCSTEHNIHS